MRFLFILLLPLQTWALSCFHPSSGLMVSVNRDESQVHFQFKAGRGYDSIPQFEGPISKADMGLVQYQTESLKELGDHFEISLPASACDFKKSKDGIFACYFDGPIAGTGLRFSAVTGYRIRQMHASGEFELQNFRLLIGKQDLFFFAVPFPVGACSGSL